MKIYSPLLTNYWRRMDGERTWANGRNNALHMVSSKGARDLIDTILGVMDGELTWKENKKDREKILACNVK